VLHNNTTNRQGCQCYIVIQAYLPAEMVTQAFLLVKLKSTKTE